MHGDYRLDNMLFDPDRTRITVVDWQTVGRRTCPARDLAYFTGTSLLPAARSRARRGPGRAPTTGAAPDYGITDYDRETCWRDYRVGMLQVPLLVAPGIAFAISTERGDDMMLAMLEPRLPGDPRSRQPRPASERSDPGLGLGHGRHRAHAVGQRRPATITTGIPSASAASSFARVMSPPLFLVTSASMRCSRNRFELVVVAVRAAGQQQLVAQRHHIGVGRGHRPDQEPRVETGEAHSTPQRPVVRKTRE